jgi:hypothetical protein
MRVDRRRMASRRTSPRGAARAAAGPERENGGVICGGEHRCRGREDSAAPILMRAHYVERIFGMFQRLHKREAFAALG